MYTLKHRFEGKHIHTSAGFSEEGYTHKDRNFTVRGANFPMKCNGISKRPQRSRRRSFLRALAEYLTSDSYMYGPLLYPNNYSRLTAANRRSSPPGSFWQTKGTSVAVSSVKIHKSIKPSSNNQSTETTDPWYDSGHQLNFLDVPMEFAEKLKHTIDGDRELNFRDVPIESAEKVKQTIERSASPVKMDHICEPDSATTVTRRLSKNKKKDYKEKNADHSSSMRV